MQAQAHKHTVEGGQSLGYLLYLPDDHEEADYPLILFLHGSGERGTDLDQIKLFGLTQKIESGDDVTFIVIAPQCPPDTRWESYLPALKDIVDTVVDHYRVDTTRIYCTGLSMGGAGTWSLTTAYPDLFAAAIPICGRERMELGYPERLQRITHLPVWCFHGDADPVVPVESSIYLTKHLREYGGNPKLTIYEGVDHDSWTQTYANPDIYDWLLEHRLDVEK